MTIKLPAQHVARYDIAEIFELINRKAETREDVKIVLQKYATPELKWYLKTMYSDVAWKIGEKLPRWKITQYERGNTFSTLQHQLPRFKSLIIGVQPDMSQEKAKAIFLDAIEVIHADEAKWIGWLIRKTSEKKIKFMSIELVREVFPDLGV